MVIRKTIKEVIILVGISVALALVVNTISPRGIAVVGKWDIAEGVITAGPAGDADDHAKEIDSVARAKYLFDKDAVLFVDARSQDDYEDGHIRGAISFPVGRFDEQIESFLNQHSPEIRIVTYCSGRTCEDSHHLARLLADIGFTHVSVFIDGFPGWEAQGFPIE